MESTNFWHLETDIPAQDGLETFHISSYFLEVTWKLFLGIKVVFFGVVSPCGSMAYAGIFNTKTLITGKGKNSPNTIGVTAPCHDT